MKLSCRLTVLLTIIVVSTCIQAAEKDEKTAPGTGIAEFGVREIDGVKKKTVPGFGGVIAKRFEDSEEWWPPYRKPGEGAPNAKKRQYYEMFANRAIWMDGWKAVILHDNRMTIFAMRSRFRTTTLNSIVHCGSIDKLSAEAGSGLL